MAVVKSVNPENNPLCTSDLPHDTVIMTPSEFIRHAKWLYAHYRLKYCVEIKNYY